MFAVQALVQHPAVTIVPLLVALVTTNVWAAEPPMRAAVPDEMACSRAELEIKELFKTDYARRRPADMEALADKLLQQAQETTGSSAGRFVLFREAARLAAQAGEIELSFRTIDAEAHVFSVSAIDLKAEALRTASRANAAASAQKALAESALALQHEAIAADAYQLASDLASLAEACAGRAKAAALARQATAAFLEAREVGKEYERTRPAAAKLKALPDDPEANLEVGRFLCLRKGDWEHGLPMLHAGSEIRLKELALRDLGSPSDAVQQAELGDGWWDLGEAEKGLARANLRRRAYHWYRQAQPRLTGLAQTRTEQRIKVLTEEFPDLLSLIQPGLLRTLEGHAERVNRVAVHGRYALSTSDDGSVRLWDIDTGREVRKLAGHTAVSQAVAFSTDGRLGASAGNDRMVRVWNLVNGQELRRFQADTPHQMAVAISPEGKRILAGGGGGAPSLHLWSLDTGKPVLRFAGIGGPWAIHAVGFTPDGRSALTIGGSDPPAARLWDLRAGKESARLATFPALPWCASISGDGRRAAVGTLAGTVHVLDLPTLTEARRFTAHQGACYSVALSPDGRRVVTGGGGQLQGGTVSLGPDNTVAVWEADSAKLVQRFQGHTHAVMGLALTGDGRRAVSGSWDKTLKVWGLPR